MNVIEEKWQDYRKQTLKEEVDPVILGAYRAVFYAGAISTAAIITELKSVEGAMETIMQAAVEHVAELESKGVAPNLKNNSGGKCCERDHNGDGNCDIHAAPGVLRKK